MSDLKLEAGKFYVTRDGCKAHCRGTSAFAGDLWLMETQSNSYCVYSTGRVSSIETQSPRDIVEPWPVEYEVEVIITRGPDGTIYATNQEIGIARPLARKRITLSEGEGL